MSSPKLFPYQATGAAWLRSRRAAVLADEMGLGKTAQALFASAPDDRVLIVCPASLKLNWRDEARIWRPDLEPVVLKGRKSFRFPAAGELVIVNYDILPAPGELAPPRPPPAVTIFDEAHYAKSPRAKRTKAARAVARMSGRAWLLTGTPLVRCPLDLWNVLKLGDLETEAFGTFPKFLRLFRAWKGPFGYKFRAPLPAAVEGLRRVMLRRRRVDVLPELPVKRYQDIPVNSLPRDTRSMLEEVRRHLEEAGIDLEAAVSSADLRVLTNPAGGMEWSRARRALAEAKVPAMLEQILDYQDAGEPLVVFSAHRAPIELLGQKEGWATILGDTPHAARHAAVTAFQAGELKGIAGTIGAMGTGLTLTRACHALFVDLSFSPADNAQAEDRICRIGQDRGVLIKRLVADHQIDRAVAAILRRKQALIEASIEASIEEASK